MKYVPSSDWKTTYFMANNFADKYLKRLVKSDANSFSNSETAYLNLIIYSLLKLKAVQGHVQNNNDDLIARIVSSKLRNEVVSRFKDYVRNFDAIVELYELDACSISDCMMHFIIRMMNIIKI